MYFINFFLKSLAPQPITYKPEVLSNCSPYIHFVLEDSIILRSGTTSNFDLNYLSVLNTLMWKQTTPLLDSTFYWHLNSVYFLVVLHYQYRIITCPICFYSWFSTHAHLLSQSLSDKNVCQSLFFNSQSSWTKTVFFSKFFRPDCARF